MDYRYYADGVVKKNSYGINTPVYSGLFGGMSNASNNQKSSSKNRIIDLTNQIPTVFVYSGFLKFNHNDIENVVLQISDIYNKGSYSVLGLYNQRTGKYYVAYQQINKHLRVKHFFRARYYSVDNNMFSTFRDFSELKLYGYAVGVSGRSKYDRQNIIMYVIDNNIMTAGEIISHLQGQIALRNNRDDKDFSVAINDWKNDIAFVRDYMFRTRKMRRVMVNCA